MESIMVNFTIFVSKVIGGISVLGLVFSVIGAARQPAVLALETTADTFTKVAVPGPPVDCSTRDVRLSLASEQISFCSPTRQPIQLVEDDISDPEVSYAQLNQVNGYGLVNIKSVAAGYSPGIGRPGYNLGAVDKYRQEVWAIETSKKDRGLSTGPTGIFWNETVASIQIETSLPTSLGIVKLRSIEWYVEHKSRLWSFIITWDTGVKNSNEWQGYSTNFSVQPSGSARSADPVIDLGVAALELKAASKSPINGSLLVEVGTPSWWSGECDDDNYFDGTGVHSFPLGASWLGVSACGPVTFKDPFPRHLVQFFPKAWGEYEFECVELVMRFLYQQWGIKPWQGSANTIKDSPPASIEFFPNGTPSIVPGDIITENGINQNSSGHAMIITGVDLDEYGTGFISILEQNTSNNGSRSLHVTNWTVDPDPYTWGQTIQGWLHVKANQDLPLTISGNTGISSATLRFNFNGPQTVVAAHNGSYSLNVSTNWSGSVMPDLWGYIFLPGQIIYSNLQTDQTGQDYTPVIAQQIFLPMVIR
jgi:hypothetical protein